MLMAWRTRLSLKGFSLYVRGTELGAALVEAVENAADLADLLGFEAGGRGDAGQVLKGRSRTKSTSPDRRAATRVAALAMGV